ncbi:protein CAJ1 isoform X3 [Olea europaea var. sylvestris]|uniref:protein CAJ1 isoform X3 n=1 Tax=Olea europaea var. sylvestris TaxID=158386 RepID=UPI000C1D8B13|nr:protein CAJ1 isoform X3 [Olea europaea var. sylvestris]
MQGDEAKTLLGFPPHSYPSTSQIKAAYRKKVWETHPDRFPNYEKVQAECKFKLISEAYSFLLNSGGSGQGSQTGAFTLGGSTAARAYRKQKESCASYNPFLP